MIECYLIRHKPTGNFIPCLDKGHRRGGSWVEPVPSSEKMPRIFATVPSARGFLSAWCQGTFKGVHEQSGEFGEDTYESVEVTPQPHRVKADMEIVPFVLTEKGGDQ